jgi:hypothetical protein
MPNALPSFDDFDGDFGPRLRRTATKIRGDSNVEKLYISLSLLSGQFESTIPHPPAIQLSLGLRSPGAVIC